MSENLSANFRVDPIYLRMTQPRQTSDNRSSLPSVQDLFGQLSQTSQFKVSLFFNGTGGGTSTGGNGVNNHLRDCGLLDKSTDPMKYDFMCHSATLPGSNLGVTEETGSRQGLVEKFAVARQFPDLTLEFYVDSEYGIIRVFEEWMHYINPLYNGTTGVEYDGDRAGSTGRPSAYETNNYYRMRYPEDYKRSISVTKFERNIIVDNQNVNRSFVETPSMLTYSFVNAFPTQLTALPVSYEGSTVTKTSVTFAYDRYVVQKHTSTTASRGTPLEIAAGQLINVIRPQ